MKTAIVTLPLHTNYGGILQAFALKTLVEGLGHSAVVLDRKEKKPSPSGLKAPMIYAKRMVQRYLLGKKTVEVFSERRFRREYPYVSSLVRPFVESYVAPRMIGDYSEISGNEYDAFIVGSDQVWRPRYFGHIEDAFLAFAVSWDVKKVAYAASFGTEELEYEYMQLESCSALLADFDAVSVRETSAVKMCDEWFDCDSAVHVLDPVMMLPKGTYSRIASSASRRDCRGKILNYVLDRTASKSYILELISRRLGKEVHDASVSPYEASVPLEKRVVPPMEEWLACFEDADFVVTDSFHGCVLSILFHKPFVAVANTSRGVARMDSLMSMFGLDERLVAGLDPEDDGEIFLKEIDWERVDAELERRRADSLEFLKKSLTGTR